MKKPFWEGKEYSFFSHKKCEYFPCHKGADPENFNCLFCYCPLYALGEKCGGNFVIQKTGSRTARAAWFPTDGKITDISPENTESLRR